MFSSSAQPKVPANRVIPRHIAIIPDGNGRWSKARGLPVSAGHKRGAEVLKKVVEDSMDLGVEFLTIYAFSSENWNRPKQEVSDLMGLLRYYLKTSLETFIKKGVRLHVIGDRSTLDNDLVSLLEEAEEKSKNNSRLVLTIAISYGGRQELVEMTKSIVKGVQEGLVSLNEINESTIENALQTGFLPEPDIVLRTSGEKRVSNFLLWKIAYSEFIFTDVLWPDFKKSDLESVIDEFNKRERRFGARIV